MLIAVIRLQVQAGTPRLDLSRFSLRSRRNLLPGKVIAAALLTVGSQLAHAAHPLNTDDTATQGAGQHQLEVNSDRLYQAETKTNVGALIYTYGLRSNLDLFVNAPVTASSPSGINDVTLGLKWQFFDQHETSAALRADLNLPSGDSAQGLGTGRTSAALTVIGSHAIGRWNTHANIGVAMNRYALITDRDTKRLFVWRASVAALYAVTPHWRLVVDTGISQNSERFNSALPAYVLTGAIYSPSSYLDFDAGLRFGIGCKGCADRIDRQIGAGVTWRF